MTMTLTKTRLGTTPAVASKAMAEGILSALTMVMETSMTNSLGLPHTAVPEEVHSPWTTTTISTFSTLPHPRQFILVEVGLVHTRLPTTNTLGIHASSHPLATTTVAPTPLLPSQPLTTKETTMCLPQEARRTPGTVTATLRIGAEAPILHNTPAP